MDSYQHLLVWQRAADLAAASYRAARQLPASEQYELARQIRRAALSVPANIAEGNGRSHRGAYLHHLSIAMGSLKELESHLRLAVRLDFLRTEETTQAMALCDQVGRLLTGLTRSLKRREKSVGSRESGVGSRESGVGNRE